MNISPYESDYQWSTDFTGTLDGYHDWFTLSGEEWSYLLNSRTDAGNKYATATVCGVQGLVLLPDNWTIPDGCTFTPGKENGYATNTYDATAWALMEANGAVFLPAAGYRDGVSLNWDRARGYYWSSTGSWSGTNCAFCGMYFDYDTIFTDYYEGDSRSYWGMSVRLVRNN